MRPILHGPILSATLSGWTLWWQGSHHVQPCIHWNLLPPSPSWKSAVKSLYPGCHMCRQDVFSSSPDYKFKLTRQWVYASQDNHCTWERSTRQGYTAGIKLQDWHHCAHLWQEKISAGESKQRLWNLPIAPWQAHLWWWKLICNEVGTYLLLNRHADRKLKSDASHTFFTSKFGFCWKKSVSHWYCHNVMTTRPCSALA